MLYRINTEAPVVEHVVYQSNADHVIFRYKILDVVKERSAESGNYKIHIKIYKYAVMLSIIIVSIVFIKNLHNTPAH